MTLSLLGRKPNVVNKSRPPDPYGEREDQPAAQGLDRLKAVGAHHLGIFNTREGLRIQHLPQALADGVPPALPFRDRRFSPRRARWRTAAARLSSGER